MKTFSDPFFLSANASRASACIQFLKGPDRVYLAANSRMAQFFGARSANDIVGRRTSDFFDHESVDRYDQLDEETSAGKTLIDRFDYTYDHTGQRAWYLYSRTATFHEGVVVTRGLSFPLAQAGASSRVQARVARLATALTQEIDQPVCLKQMARDGGLSVAQMERDFRSVLGLTPRQYRLRQKVQAAINLIGSGKTLTEIAQQVGYSEHSALTRIFKSVTGLTPRDFRATLLSQ